MSSNHHLAGLQQNEGRESPPPDSERPLQSPPRDVNRPQEPRSDCGRDGNWTEFPAAKLINVHTVQCSLTELGHTHHKRRGSFWDTPTLYAGDSQATPLRGKKELQNLNSHLESVPQISFVVERTYQCEKFHGELEKAGHYRKVEIGPTEAQLPMQLRPYLSVLGTGASQPESTKETMSISRFGALRHALKACFDDGWDTHATFEAPYWQLYHARAQINVVESQLKEAWRHEIRDLYRYLDERFKDEYAEADALLSQGFFTRPHFSNLFTIGDVLVNTEGPEPVAMLAKRILSKGESEVSIECNSWSFDGLFKQATKTVRISVPSRYSAEDKIPIASLIISPLRLNLDSLRDTLHKRGEIFWHHRKGGLISYTAPTKGFDIYLQNVRCMIDMEAYNELYGKPNDSKEHGEDQQYRDETIEALMEQKNPPSDTFLLLLPPNIKAFRFHDKKWKSLAVKHISPITWNKAAFESLVLKQDKKDLIEALVTNHLESSTMADVIEGKGNGLVILLHGGPGTGKTLTAESVAEIAERPLYRLTCGDIGTEAEIVEKSLEHIFYLGSIWKAVVVLDEAEVFLEERTQADLQRNALVSVFLRALEYYNGILILTTNRVGTFDEAFKSRIHLALHYPPLNSDDRWRVWSNFIGSLRDENAAESGLGVNHEELRKKVDALARHKLNGRQIRNSVRTANQLAKFKGEVLCSKHIEKTIEVIKEFEKYVEDTHGHTDADWVSSTKIRVDEVED